MPATPPATPRFGLPRRSALDAADYPTETNAVVDLIDTEVAALADVVAEADARTLADANNPTADQKAALAGTSGAPANANRYVTDGDARNSNARLPTVHAPSHAPGGSDPIAGITFAQLAGSVWPVAHMEGTFGVMPPAGPANFGLLYLAHDSTETSQDGVYWSSGSAWIQISGPPLASGILVGARVTHSVTQTPSSSPYFLQWDTPTDNAIGMWSAGDHTKLVVPVGYGGGYEVGAAISLAGTSQPWQEGFHLVVNGTEQIGAFSPPLINGASSPVGAGSVEVPLAAGDVVQVQINFDGGGDSSVKTGHLPQFWARRVANA